MSSGGADRGQGRDRDGDRHVRKSRYSTEIPLSKYRDVTRRPVADGTAGIQKRIIATAMMGKAAAL
jgi:hypothetical protein